MNYQFHTKEQLRKELNSINYRIWAAKEFKWNLTASQKRAMQAEKKNLQSLIRIRKG